MSSNTTVVTVPVAAEAGAPVEPRSRLRGSVGDLAKVVVVSTIAYAALLGSVLNQASQTKAHAIWMNARKDVASLS